MSEVTSQYQVDDMNQLVVPLGERDGNGSLKPLQREELLNRMAEVWSVLNAKGLEPDFYFTTTIITPIVGTLIRNQFEEQQALYIRVKKKQSNGSEEI